ncbi:MAG: hypothetical protein RDV48_31220 [Candidatus Eremiobacteraeota bacterium]|nr:hypothetical protein [Candidatus Eremiobacteraeota bacterium]
MDKFADSKNKVDFVFSLYPLWVTYSGLPQHLGATAWCIYKRLLELRYRFGSRTFFYPLERLCATTGITKAENIKTNLNKLVAAGLIRFKTSQGRGKAAEFEMIEPINAPLSEEDVYRLHPRLQSKSYRRNLHRELTGENPPEQDVLLKEKKILEQGVLGRENPPEQDVLLKEKILEQGVLGRENPPEQGANKKDIYKKDNNNKNDLSHEGKLDHEKAAHSEENVVLSPVVVALDEKMLKEYGIAGEAAKTWLKKYSPAYLLEKVEILEYKAHQGEAIKNRGGMLKKAVEEDWQPPEGFSTRTQREEAARREREAAEAERREAASREENERRERELARAAEEWKKTATREEKEKVYEKALKEVSAEHPGTEERFLRVPLKLRELKIISEEYLGGNGRSGK